MPDYVDPAVEELRASPSSAFVTLLIGATGDRDDLSTAIEPLSVTVRERMGRTALLVDAPKSIVDELCKLDEISSRCATRETRNPVGV